MGNEPEITTDEKSAYAKIKQMKATNIKSSFKKYGNLPLKKLMAYQALSTKVKNWWKTEDQMFISKLLLQKQNKNEVKMLH